MKPKDILQAWDSLPILIQKIALAAQIPVPDYCELRPSFEKNPCLYVTVRSDQGCEYERITISPKNGTWSWWDWKTKGRGVDLETPQAALEEALNYGKE